MSRWNLTARKSCRNRAGVSPQTRTSIAGAAEQDRLGERDVVAVQQLLRRCRSSNLRTRCSSFRSANRRRSTCSGGQLQLRGDARPGPRRGRTAAGLRRAARCVAAARKTASRTSSGGTVGRDLELAAVFEQLRQPLVDELAAGRRRRRRPGPPRARRGCGPGASRKANRSCSATPSQSRVARVEVQRDELVPGVPDADELAGEHETD